MHKSLIKINKAIESLSFHNIKNSRVWYYQALLSLADEDNSIYEYFAEIISKFLGKTISHTEAKEWKLKNAAYITGNAWDWDIGADKQATPRLENYFGSSDSFEIYNTVYTSSKDLEEDIKRSALLERTENIPPLYYYQIAKLKEKTKKYNNIDKRLYPYFFMHDALTLLIQHDPSDENFTKFVLENKDKLDKILKFSTKRPQLLRCRR